MANRCLEQINTIKKLDAEVSRKDIANSSNITILNDKKKKLLGDNFIKESERLIHRSANSCRDSVSKLCQLQDGVNIGDNYKLRTYLNASSNVYNPRTFIFNFADECRIFNSNINSVLNADSMTSASIPDCLKRAAKAYATILAIDDKAETLIKEHLLPRYNAGLNDADKDIAAAEQAKEEYIQKARQQLQVEIKKLENLIMQEEARLSECTIRNDSKMASDFPADYKLLIGKTLEYEPQRINLSNVKYNKTVHMGNAAAVAGYIHNKSGNIVLDTTASESISDEFVDNLIMKFITSYPTKFKKVVALHNQSGSSLLHMMSRVYSCGSQGEFAFRKEGNPVANSEEEIENMLALLDKRVNDVCSKLGKDGEHDVYSYNAKNPDNAEPITLVVVKDFPSGFTRGRALNLFQRVYEQGNKAGITMVVLWSKKFVKEEYGEGPKALKLIESLPAAFRLVSTQDGMKYDGNRAFAPLTVSSDFSDKAFFAQINEELKQQDKPIDLFDIQPKENFESSPRRKEFSEQLIIPLGKDGAQPTSLKLSSSDKAHVVVNGGTGSGKTAFLHTLILSAANNYSPDELEINLFDFKDGVGFKMYKEKRLPHVNFIALENKIEDAQDILTYINNLMTERNKLISSFEGVNSLRGYNEKVATGKYPDKPKIPRCLIIIDEYQFLLMNEKCISVLENIARQGRSAGMSLVLVSQDVPTDSGFTKIKQLLDHRFAFRGSPDNVERLISGAGKRAAELELQKGLCFYEANDGRIKSMRSAFSGDDAKLAKNIDKIVAKYKGEYRPLQVVGSPKPLCVEKMSDVPTLPAAQLKKDYLDAGECHFTLGRYCITQKPVEYVANELNTLLVIVGNYIKSKQVVASIISGMLRILRDVDDKKNKIILTDLCEQRRLIQVPSPLSDIIAKKNELEDEGDETTLEALTCYDADGFDEMVDHICDVYDERCENKSMALDPIEVIIMNADNYSTSGSAMERLRNVIVNGKKCDIYFTIQLDSLDSAFAKNLLFGRSNIQLKDLILLSDGADDSTPTSLGIRSALNAVSGLIGGRVSTEYIKSLEKNPLHHAHSFIIDDGNISKYSHFNFQKGWIDSLIDEIK